MQKLRALLIAAYLFTASCGLTDKHWTYKLTREAADTGYWSLAGEIGSHGGLHCRSGTDPRAAAVFLGVVLLLPPILDTAFLPIAGTHDLFFID